MTKTFHSCGSSVKAFAIMAFSGLLVLLPAPSADAAKRKGRDYCA